MADVYVLGSGFSAKAGAPLTRSVLGAIFSPGHDPHLQELKSFLDDFLFRGQHGWPAHTQLEEVLSRLDLIRHYRPYPNTDYDRVSHYEELLLEEFTKLLSPANIDANQPEYRCFSTILKPGDRIISFNYDLVAETLLTMAGREYDYNLNTADFGLSGAGINLFKLHGSINQYYCPVCGQVYVLSASSSRTGQCHVELRHFIIAPTLFKSYSMPSLRNLWFKALQSLALADRIFFIGYSLPASDILSYQLFDFGKRLAPNGQQVFLVNGPRSAADRFVQIYGRGLINKGVCFEEWVFSHVFSFP